MSPIKMQEMILSQKEKNLSKERSYLKEVERPRRRMSIDSKSEEDEDDDDLGERDNDYQIEEEEDEEEEEEEEKVPIKVDRSKHHRTRLRKGASPTPSLSKKLKQPLRGPTTQELKKRKNVEALKRLQQRDLEENRTGGTYVQCCNQMCAKWRLVAEYLESSQVGFHILACFLLIKWKTLFPQVPEHWVCGMIGEKCGVGGHDFMSNRDLLDVKVNLPRTCRFEP